MTEQGTQPKGSRTKRSEKDRPEDPAKASAQLWLRLFLLALFAAVVTSGLMLPWKVLALVLAVAAVAIGVVALVKVISTKLNRAVLLATIVGLAGALFLAFGIGAAVLLWPITERYEDCMSRALTLQATSECKDALRQFNGLGG